MQTERDSLILDIVTVQMDANFRTMDTLYEREREMRQAYEVLIADVLDRLDAAWGGTAREYERAMKPLRAGVYGRRAELAARHRENEAQ